MRLLREMARDSSNQEEVDVAVQVSQRAEFTAVGAEIRL